MNSAGFRMISSISRQSANCTIQPERESPTRVSPRPSRKLTNFMSGIYQGTKSARNCYLVCRGTNRDELHANAANGMGKDFSHLVRVIGKANDFDVLCTEG